MLGLSTGGYDETLCSTAVLRATEVKEMATWMSHLELTQDLLRLGLFRLVDAQKTTMRAPSQLLPIIASLRDDGLVEVKGVVTPRGKTYAVTPKGQVALVKIEKIQSMTEERSIHDTD